MKRLEDPENYELSEFDAVNATAVYVGGLIHLKKMNHRLVWREDKEGEQITGIHPFKVLTLKEISQQLQAYPIITVIIDSPLRGEILQWGNYGDEWWQIGETSGYA